MIDWKLFLSHVVTYFDVVLVCYFVIGNGFNTLLILMSLAEVFLHNRRLAYEALGQLRESPVTPPVTVIIPAANEQEIIVEAVRSILKIDYPGVEVIVVDDGSTDATLERLISAFNLVETGLIYRPRIPTRAIRGFYLNPLIPNLMLISKENGGKPDALNVGLNMCRSPYFCTLDSDCFLERNALLRVMRPIIRSTVHTVASGGIIRVLNGSKIKDGQVVKVGLPHTSLERFQVVEYLRSFLFGRTGWHLLGGTLIVSGAFSAFHTETVIEVGGFGADTVAEDMELIVRIHRWAFENNRHIRMSFTSDPVCWAESPTSFRALARQRRRWQLGLCQTLWKYFDMIFAKKYGVVGLLSLPFHAFIEGMGAVVELFGYFFLCLAMVSGMVLPSFFIPVLVLALSYGAFLSVASVLLEELTYQRYPSFRDLTTLLIYAVLENFGYRQLVLLYRFGGIIQFLLGIRKWEKVHHAGATAKPTLAVEQHAK